MTSLYTEKDAEQANVINDEFKVYLKRKMEELGKKVKKSLPTKAI